MATQANEHHLAVTPIGAIDASLCEAVSSEAGQFFGIPTRIVTLINNVDFAYDAERNQYCSTRILEKLDLAAPPWAVKLIGITRVDLFIPILTHVYGEAQLGGRACIISTCRLDENPYPFKNRPSLQTRVVKEAIHELGHTFKLRHCPDRSCIMHYCRSIQDVDQKSSQFCRHCTVMLQDGLRRLTQKTPG